MRCIDHQLRDKWVRPNQLKQLFMAAGMKWLEDKSPRLGAAVAFYSMLSIGPVLLLFLSVAAMMYGAEAAQGQLLHQIDGLLGHEGARAIQDMLARANSEDHGMLASIISIITLFFAASGVFGELQDSFNDIWKVPTRTGSGFINFLRTRFLSFSMVLGTGFLLLISLIVNAILSAWNEMGTNAFPGYETLMVMMNTGISFSIVTLLFASIFKYIPDTHIKWADVLPGAVVTAILFTLGKFAIGLYLGHSAVSSAYGAGGSLVVVLVWVYYSAQIMFFGAEFTYVYAHRNKPLLKHM